MAHIPIKYSLNNHPLLPLHSQTYNSDSAHHLQQSPQSNQSSRNNTTSFNSDSRGSTSRGFRRRRRSRRTRRIAVLVVLVVLVVIIIIISSASVVVRGAGCLSGLRSWGTAAGRAVWLGSVAVSGDLRLDGGAAFVAGTIVVAAGSYCLVFERSALVVAMCESVEGRTSRHWCTHHRDTASRWMSIYPHLIRWS